MNIGTTGTAVVSDDDAALDSGTIDGGNQFSIDDTEFTSSAYPNNAGTGVEIYSAHVTGGGMITFFYLTSASDGVDDAVDRIVLLSGSISPGQKIVNFKLLSNTTSIPYVDIPSIVICFTPGTMITTPRGQVPVETLSAGDLVITADNGLQTIRWVGAKRMTGARLMAYPELRPIRIRKNAFGEGLPLRDMWVSPQHRMLVSSEKNLLEHGEQELLVPAKALLNDLSITVDYGIRSTEYIHILFDKHEIIFANGSATESFHPGASALSGIEDAARDELFDIFPELETDPTLYGPSARLSLRVQEGRHQPSPGGIL
ncbi:MAG: Hint domain-containing protein [Rhodobacteraceae bacterium]|nr:Hint domain-containing protein [Paracoccaceae bacterium]